jgi:helicase MOV-10
VREDGAYDEEAHETGLHNMDEFARRMERATLDNLDEDDEEENNADRPWRELE